MSRAASSARLAVVGAGAWGTVLALLLQRNGNEVTLWARRHEQAESIRKGVENRERLPGIELPRELQVTSDLAEAIAGKAAAFLAVPSTAFAAVAGQLSDSPAIVSCSKGLIGPGLTRLSEVIEKQCPGSTVAVLSGPNLAAEIGRGLPAAAVIASRDQELGRRAQSWLQSPSFRVYTSPDPIGTEIGGALKNVIALASGMSDALRLGDNAKATIVTRGLAEIVKVGIAVGSQRETLYGLAGLGDLVATCSSRESRNHRAGESIARGASLTDLAAEGLTAEGIPTVKAVHSFATEQNLELPIATEVYRVVFEGKSPRRAIEDLMSRARRAEW